MPKLLKIPLIIDIETVAEFKFVKVDSPKNEKDQFELHENGILVAKGHQECPGIVLVTSTTSDLLKKMTDAVIEKFNN